ncbi:MAG: hypothetical protein JWO46_3059 [Nocardioidaceae bacterium]|nr:hypothetical protein [Nocardioidaceae bacterium]
MTDDFGDVLVIAPTPEMPERFFDRFVFNLHPDGVVPSLVLGAGLHPHRDVVDGFVVATTATEQRNLRFSTRLSTTDAGVVGPFAWRVVEPMRTWHLSLADNPSGVAFDLTWRARTPAWTGSVTVENDGQVGTAFDHLFQSGRYDGSLTIDGTLTDVTGWWGQRDRSRGVRTMAGGQGLHLWVQAQLPTCSVGFLLVEDRLQRRLLLEGAVMHEDGRLDPVVGVRHDLLFDDGLDLREGILQVATAGGATYVLECDASARGGYLAGGGYGGHHGTDLGEDHVEHDTYPLDGSVDPRSLDSALVDRATTFRCNGETGWGILEFAHSRSAGYTYRPTFGG